MEPTLKPAHRNRALRKPFVAPIVIADVASERQISARTSDLSVHGCFATTATPLNPGAKVWVTVVHAGAKIVAVGHVVSAHAEGMGIAFTNIEPGDQAVLEPLDERFASQVIRPPVRYGRSLPKSR